MPAKGEQVKVSCANCGKMKEIPIGSYNKSESKMFFCDRKCQGDYRSKNCRGENHHAFNSVLVCCSHCKAPVLRNKATYEAKSDFFCGYQCQAKWRSNNKKGVNSPLYAEKVQVTCAMCGNKKEVVPSVAEKHKLHFCDRWCQGAWKSVHQRGENCGMWKGGGDDFPYPPEWTEKLREKIRDRDQRKCRLCGAKENGRKLDVHHIDYNKSNCEEDNLISLCHGICHGKTRESVNQEKWMVYFKSLLSPTYFKRFFD